MFNYIKFNNFMYLSFDETWAWIVEKPKTKKDAPKLPEEQKIPVIEWAKAERDELSSEKMATITNKEFLRVWFERRLKHITSPKIDFDKVASWEQKEINFTFTFDWKFNRELYMNTTAWQVLPKEVNVVKIWGETFSRTWLKWEFFSSKWERLIIKDWTKIEIPWVRDKSLIEKQEKENASSLSNFLAENPNADKLIVKEAIERGIDPKFALIAFKDKYDKAPDWEKESELEDMMTYFDKYRWYYWDTAELKDWRYLNKLAVWVIKKFNNDWWEEKSINYWVSKDYIDDFKSTWEIYVSMKSNEIENNDSLSDGTYKKGDVLLRDQAFREKLQKVCNKLGANFEDMVKLMKAESWLDPRIMNWQSWATGLIQFMPKTAEGLWTSIWKIRKMTAVEQLDLVEQYFNNNKNWADLSKIENLYKVVFYPYALRQSDDYVFWSHNWYEYKVAQQNWVISKFSTRSDWLIDWHCFAKYVQNHVSRFSA